MCFCSEDIKFDAVLRPVSKNWTKTKVVSVPDVTARTTVMDDTSQKSGPYILLVAEV